MGGTGAARAARRRLDHALEPSKHSIRETPELGVSGEAGGAGRAGGGGAARAASKG